MKAERFAAAPLAWACLLSILTSQVWADEGDVFNASIFATVATDNNLFRLPDNVSLPSSINGNNVRSDTIHSQGINVTLDKTYSLQKIHLGANLADNRFQNFSFLDYQTKGFDAAWSWSLTPNLNGKISRDRTQSLNNFEDFHNISRNVKTLENRIATIAYGASGNWQMFGGAGRSHSSNDILIEETGDPATRFAEAGLKYLDSDGDSLSLLSRTSRIDLSSGTPDPLNQIDPRATQHDTELQLNWQISGKSRLKATVTQLERNHENFSSRNYGGTAGNLIYTWIPGEKTQVPIALSRNYVSWWDLTSSYMVVKSLTLTPFWQPTQKIALKLRLDRTRRDFLGPIMLLPEPLRQDNTRSAQLTLNWVPLRNLSISALLQKERRSSNQSDREYRDSVAAVNVQISF